MQCRNCSGNEFKQTKTGNYKCSYCSTLYYEESKRKLADFIPLRKRIIITALSVFVIFTVVIMVMVNTESADEKNSESAVSSTSENNGSTFTNQEKLPPPEGEIISVDTIPDSIGNVYFLAMCKNTGKVALNKPDVTIRLLSEKGEKIASGKGYAFIDRLNPGEVTPVYILVTSCPKYKSYETDFTPEIPYVIPEEGIFTKKFSGEFSDVSLKQTDSMNNHRLRGKIRNTSGLDARYVQVAAILYDKNHRAVGYGETFINEKTLKPDSFDFFEIYLTTVTAEPDYYKLYYEGNVD